MNHIVDDLGNIHSMSDENYLAMRCSMRSSKFNISILKAYDDCILSVGQEWFVKIGRQLHLNKIVIIDLTEKTIKVGNNTSFGFMIQTVYALNDIKFIERLK